MRSLSDTVDGNATKTKTIKLSDGHAPDNATLIRDAQEWEARLRFRVEQVTDSARYRTGQLLERDEVERLCAASDWRVTITSAGGR